MEEGRREVGERERQLLLTRDSADKLQAELQQVTSDLQQYVMLYFITVTIYRPVTIIIIYKIIGLSSIL